ncbi:MAG: type I polyketide synthase, partial [Betaproteobacteria bacterium]
LREGRESIRFFTPEEMREAGVPEAAIADPRYVPARGYLDDADKFDAGFFGYSAREAEVMDPQQRVLLQCGAEALERAGYDPERYDGAIGVFAGSTMSTYLASLTEQGAVPESVGGLSRVMAMAQDFLTTRLSYKLNLRGPSVNVQSACSTSLVAVHEACRSLLDYDCDMALAGGVSVTVPLKAGYPYVEEGIGSPDGHCRAFDASAAGTVAGNAVALVVLKRLSEAIADGDHIHAVIRGIAVNNDGCAKVGYTAPSVEGQSKAIALAQALANCPPETIGYIEAHGTGTHLGDPIEISALRRVFGPRPRNGEPCWIGAVKANVGHLDAAAGVTGLMKAALTVEHAEIPASINFVEPNPQIEFASSPFEVNTQLRAWKTPEGHTRRAGVSSFGLGGTNAHAVLEQAPAAEACAPGREWQLLCLSAKTPAALERMAANLAAHLRAHPELPLADVAHTLQAGRREFAHRRVVVARSHEQAACALESAADASAIAACKAGSRKPVFMFSGQGSQHVGMARGLYATEPVFREVVDQCGAKLRPMLGVDLVDVMFGATGAPEEAARRLEDTRLAQPALFVVEYATARTWMSWGVRPAAMIGHSIGEYAAACLADVIGLDDALRLVAERGRLMSLQAAGAMLAVPLDEAEVATLLGAELSLAAVNAPGLCVVSGPQAAIERLEAQLEARDLVPRRLHTSHAFHSAMMDPALEPFRAACSAVTLHAPRLAYVSNVSGDWITPEQATDPGYYATHLRGTVRFSQGLERLLADGDHVFVECGPGQTLASLARRHPARRGQACIASMRHPADAQEDAAAWLAAAGQLWLAGARPDWRAAHGGERRRRVLLPTYPFECKRYWLEARSSAAAGDAAVRRIADSKQWLYVPSWRRSAPPVADPAAARSKWLVLCDPHGVGSELVAHWRAAGFAVAEAAVPETRADCDRLLVWLRADAFVPDRIVHLGAVGPDVESNDEPNFTRTCQARGFYGIVFLLQSLIAANLDTDVALAVVTSQALEVDGREAISPDRAMAMAPCTSIGMEHPGIRARVVDVQLDSKPARLAAVLARELASQAHDAVVAYRGGHRWVREFERVAPAQATSPAVREGGTYLITGGLGPMGLEIAAHFARVAKANLVLLGRTASPSERIREIEAQGSKVLVLRADVGDAAQLAEAVARAEAQLGPIRGVVHAAGAQKRGAPIEAVTPVHCEAQFWPKLAGLRALERV